MSGNSTVFSIGTGTGAFSKTVTGALAAAALNAYKTQLQNASVTTWDGTGSAPTPPSNGLQNVLEITSGTGTLTVPSGWNFISYTGDATITGGGSAVFIGDLNLGTFGSPSGMTNIINVGTGNGTVVDSVPGMNYVGDAGNELIWALGAGDTLGFDAGFSTLIATGSGDAVSVDGTASVVAWMTSQANFDLMGSGYAATISAASGSTITEGTGTNYILNGNGNVATTVTGGGGNDTIWGGGESVGAGGVAYNAGTYSTSSDLFIAGAGTSTIYTAANDTVFGSTSGTDMEVQSGSQLLFVGAGGADSITAANSTIMGAATSYGPTVYASGNEQLTVGGSLAGGLYVVAGSGDNLDLASSGGSSFIYTGNSFIGSGGNDSLTLSNAGGDGIILYGSEFVNPSDTTPMPATITVMNWQSSDYMYLAGYTTANPPSTIGYSQSDITNANNQLASGNSFTLSDGTTVVFESGGKPASGHITLFS